MSPSHPAVRVASPPVTGAMADIVMSRFRRLTEREVRLLVLIVQDGSDCAELASMLGMTPGALASARQGVRRKLAVPRRQDLATFVRSTPALEAIVASNAPTTGSTGVAGTELRREKDLLRVTIDELHSVAVRARRRAATLEALPCGAGGAEQRKDEAAMAVRVAELVEAAFAAAVSEARRPVLRPLAAGGAGAPLPGGTPP